MIPASLKTSFDASQFLQESVYDPATVNALVQEIGFIFPDKLTKDIRTALLAFDLNKEKAIDALLSGISFTPNNNPPPRPFAPQEPPEQKQNDYEYSVEPKEQKSPKMPQFRVDEYGGSEGEDEASMKLIEQMLREEQERHNKELEKKKEEDALTSLLISQLEREEELLKQKKEKENEALLKNMLQSEYKEKQEQLENKTYECFICFDEYKIGDMYTLDECHHRFCWECMRSFFNTRITNNAVEDIRCPACNRNVDYKEVKEVVDEQQFLKYERFLLERTLSKDPNVRWCPKPGCGNAMIGSEDNPMMVCSSHTCQFTFCFNCREEWHADVTCNQYQEWKKENAEADQRFDAWAQQNTKPCPRCKANIEKNGGCNHMTCRACKYQFCWLCMALYKSDHWKKSKCKQYS